MQSIGDISITNRIKNRYIADRLNICYIYNICNNLHICNSLYMQYTNRYIADRLIIPYV